jgi:hypothetical protein
MGEAPALPWIAYPDIPAGSIGWRMGPGEGAYDIFYRWFSALTELEAEQFQRANPEPDEWHGIYAKIRAHPWK